MKPVRKLQFSLAALLVVVFWLSVLIATALAIYRLHSEAGWRPWYLDRERLWRQDGLNLLIGLATGGIVGAMMHRWVSGPIVGLAVAFLVDVLCFVCLGIWMRGGP